MNATTVITIMSLFVIAIGTCIYKLFYYIEESYKSIEKLTDFGDWMIYVGNNTKKKNAVHFAIVIVYPEEFVFFNSTWNPTSFYIFNSTRKELIEITKRLEKYKEKLI